MMGRDIILPHSIKDHKDKDYTWYMDDMEIEDKIKEHRKEIYRLQNCRKKQPKLAIFRKENYGTGDMSCHIFDGFKVMDEEKSLFCADYWHRITRDEAEVLKKKYNLTRPCTQGY